MKSILAAVAALFVLTTSAEAHRVGVWVGPGGVAVGVTPWGGGWHGGGMYGWQGTSPPFFYGGPVWGGGPVWHHRRHWNRGHWNGHRRWHRH